MSEKPILFSTPMVQAIINNLKSMTRRLNGLQEINENPDKWHLRRLQFNPVNHNVEEAVFEDDDQNQTIVKFPWNEEDILWVRETWYQRPNSSGYICFKASPETWYKSPVDNTYANLPWKPSIHMPRSAARLFLKVTNVRVERLQDITVEDVIAEGIDTDNNIRNPNPETHESIKNWNLQYAQFQYKELWDNLNAKRGYGWDVNPWLWVISFERTEAS